MNFEMYNGIGLKTARGTGTNGFVQKNLSFIKPKQQNRSDSYSYEQQQHQIKSSSIKKPSEEVLMHNNRRKVENEILEYQESLELSDKKYTKEEIEEKIKKRREILLKELEIKAQNGKEEVLMEVKEREMIKISKAFGIRNGKDRQEGAGFNFESEKQRKEKLERKSEAEKARRYRPY